MAFKNTGVMCIVTVGESVIDLGNYFKNEKTGERVLITSEELAKKYHNLVNVPIYTRKMKTYHILYTDIDGVFQEVLKEFSSLFWCETWLKSIGAKYWEIG